MEDHELHQMLGQMNAKIDQLLEQSHHANQKVARVEGRVDQLEKNVTWVKGAAASAGVVFTLFGAIVSWALAQLGILPTP